MSDSGVKKAKRILQPLRCLAGRMRGIFCSSPSWSALRTVGASRLLKSSWIWFVGVPIVARVRDGLLGNGVNWLALVSLPESWLWLYFGAVSIALASGAYSVFSPSLIREHHTFSDFAEGGRAGTQLVDFVTLAIGRRESIHEMLSKKNYWLKEFVERFSADPYLGMEIDRVLAGERSLGAVLAKMEISKESERDAFWFAWQQLNESRPFMRTVCAILYAAGFVCVCLVLVDNFVYVARLPHDWRWDNIIIRTFLGGE